MKIAVVALFFATSAFAQTVPALVTAACGPEKTNFKVTFDESQRTLVEPEPGKARVYFFQDAGTSFTIGYPTAKLGMDEFG
jgi:hypothetical protein